MFDGVPHEQLHQFIVSRALPHPPNSSSSSFPLPLSSFPTLPFSNSSTTFEPNTFNPHNHHHLQQLLPPQFLHHPIILHQSPSKNLNINHEEEIKEAAAAAAATSAAAEPIANNLVSSSSAATINSLKIERDIRSMPPEPHIIVDHPWSNDEVLTLLRIRSAMETWFPDFTWEHVSRKLSEVGFKRSAEKCKEKFEEESSYFSNNINNCTTRSYRFLSGDELEVELYDHTQEENPVLVPPPPPPTHPNNNIINNIGTQIKSQNIRSVALEENPSSHEFAAGQQDHEKGVATTGTSADHDYQNDVHNIDDDDDDQALNARSRIIKKRSKRNRKIKFEMFKGFCEEIVNKMMSQQEEMHNKLLEGMVKREREKVEKEEAWKKQEMDRMNKELEIMAHEQAIAGDRQATIIDFLNKFISSSSGTPTTTTTTNTNSSSSDHHDHDHHRIISQFSSEPENGKVSLTSSSSSLIQAAHDRSPNHGPNNVHIDEEEAPPPSSSAMIVRRQNSTSLSSPDDQNKNTMIITESLVIADHQQFQNPSSAVSSNPNQKVLTSSNPSPLKVTTQNPRSSGSIQNDMKEDVGKRWPRDEVLALINLRCSLHNGDHNNINQDHKEGGGGNNSVVKAPLWERISQGMSELGYKRSAKRCKEKWENINKYFRKTKDVNKKRSVDSRTCPYFHQLSTLYNKGALVSPSDQGQEIDHHQQQHHSSLRSLADHHDNHNSSVHVADQGERSTDNNVVVHHHHHHQEVAVSAAFDFEF